MSYGEPVSKRDVNYTRFQVSPSSDEFIAVGRGDWIYWHIPGWHDVRVGLADRDGRIEVTGLYLGAGEIDEFDTQQSLRPADLRELPLGRLEEFLNDPEVRDEIAGELRPGQKTDFRPNRADAVKALQQALEMPVRSAPRGGLRIKGVESRNRPDDFYRQVATAWARASQRGSNAAGQIAEENDVTVSQVHRWVKEARRRGVMAPSSRANRGDTGKD